jgi:hypothetical protein
MEIGPRCGVTNGAPAERVRCAAKAGNQANGNGQCDDEGWTDSGRKSQMRNVRAAPVTRTRDRRYAPV